MDVSRKQVKANCVFQGKYLEQVSDFSYLASIIECETLDRELDSIVRQGKSFFGVLLNG